jgi:sulfatase modifying factor 1
MVQLYLARRIRALTVAELCCALAACGGNSLSTPPPAGAGASGGNVGTLELCIPGQQIACACANGNNGAQVCRNDGSGYLACACASGVGGDAGAGGDGGAAISADGGADTEGGASPGSGAGGGSAGTGGANKLCGNGVIDSGETCDDGNKNAGDGCSPSCMLEDPFFVCTGTPSVCTRSCEQLGLTCGPDANEDCCTSIAVPGIASDKFYRSYDGVAASYMSQDYPARVGNFRLDKYEITVGRFRKFFEKYTYSLPATGSGRNPNDPSDTGWQAAWNAFLPHDQAALDDEVGCDGSEQTWTVGIDNKPMNCLSWYVAQAFCIWDGGRLPTEAEWNYAASGGTEQRVYPWGSTAPSNDDNLAVYGCYYFGIGPASCFGPDNIAPVGLIAAGNGKWGHADLAGNLAEWVRDSYAVPYAVPCDNCSVLTAAPNRVIRGGNFKGDASLLFSSYRGSQPPHTPDSTIGARCARTAP